jgi:pyruvate formate lyase activating enzyme
MQNTFPLHGERSVHGCRSKKREDIREIMIINGLSKLTLLDFPGRVAATVFLGGCNMRCPFCHNAVLVTNPENAEHIEEAELFEYLKMRRRLIDAVCITGGEPTLRQDLPELIIKIKSIGYAVKLDTNGTNPDMLEKLIKSGTIDYVAMDIKNSPAKYPKTVGIPDFDIRPVEKSASLLLQGKIEYEFRTTVVNGLHEKEDFDAIGHWLAGARQYYLQNMVDSGGILVPGTKGHSRETMEEFLAVLRQYIPGAELRGI